MKKACSILLLLCSVMFVLIEPNSSSATTIFWNAALAGGYRWDVASRNFNGLERSLDGGLPYSVQTGSCAGCRDLFSWQGTASSVFDFQQAIEDAFHAWTITDPVSRLSSDIFFLADFGTTAIGPGVGGVILTSGTVGYGGGGITGADVSFNNNPQAVYTLDFSSFC